MPLLRIHPHEISNLGKRGHFPVFNHPSTAEHGGGDAKPGLICGIRLEPTKLSGVLGRNLKPHLFQTFTPGRIDRLLTRLKFAAGKHALCRATFSHREDASPIVLQQDRAHANHSFSHPHSLKHHHPAPHGYGVVVLKGLVQTEVGFERLR